MAGPTVSSITTNSSLSERERRFVEAFMGPAAGNGTEAARLAGYKGKPKVLQVQASRLLSKAIMQAAIADRTKNDPLVADRAARQQFWTSTMLDVEQKMPDRLKASELLGRSQADFIEKHEHSGTVTLAQLLGE